MGLSHELISQFAKVVNAGAKTNSESTVYGTVVTDGNGNKYVKLDGSDQLTPLGKENQPSVNTATANTNEGDRVSVLIKNHTATVTGNISSPAASDSDVETAITKFDIAVGDQIQANKAYFKELTADKADMGSLVAAIISVAELIAKDVKMEELVAGKITVDDLIAKKIDSDVIIADTAIIEKLKADNIDVLSLIADKAVIEDLIANNASLDSVEAKNAYLKFATIDFSNIDTASISKLFADYGVINELIIEDGTVVKELVGVTIKGDLIEAGTLKADRLVVKGSDGNYYALSTDFTAMPGVTPVEEDTIHGSVLIKKSIAAEKIAVDDLVAFEATIGGFHIKPADADTNTPGAIYSGAKESIENSTPGVYLDSEGQVAFGDSTSHLKFYKDADGVYRLIVSADNIVFGAGKKFHLDDRGITVKGSSTDTNDTIETTISNNGMAVTVRDESKPTLEANDKGVIAKDLHARTYLIVGDNSRFENYGNGRTGCFWIGG